MQSLRKELIGIGKNGVKVFSIEIRMAESGVKVDEDGDGKNFNKFCLPQSSKVAQNCCYGFSHRMGTRQYCSLFEL
jgi:hypothetical protein